MTKRNIMTENLKEEIAKELGVYEQVKKRRRLGKHTFKNLRKHGNKSNRNSKQKYKIEK